jgi:hypothetical protein
MVLLMQLLQTIELWGQSAFGRGVDHQDYITPKISHWQVFAFGRLCR